MKRNFLFSGMVVLAGLALLMMSPVAHAASLRCTGADGKTACTAAQVADIQSGLATGKRMHKPLLMDVDSVSLGSDGMLVCRKAGGGMCTDQQLDAIVSLSSSTNSPEGAIHITKEIDKSSPMLMDKAAMSTSAGLRCAGADGKSACTAQQVSELNDMITTGKRMHTPFLTDVGSVSLGSNGSLVCRKSGGEVCDDGNLNAIVSLASSKKDYVGHVSLLK